MPFPPTSLPLARALAGRNYDEPTPVQTAVIETDASRDLLVSAQTGSGKTVAYGLAIGPNLLGDAEKLPRAGSPLALIVAPTRELALQVERELSWLYADAGAKIVSCVGGMDARRERRSLDFGAHIVVGTPGRLRDHLERGGLNISTLKALVIDEADEMLDLGFREDLEFILEATPAERRTLLFSATLPRAIVTMARKYQRDAHRIEVAATVGGHADIEYRAISVVHQEVERAVVNVLRFIDAPGAIVFCNTREAVRHLQSVLFERGFATVALSGELSQTERNNAMQALRDGRARVCVATDVAARGIDLPGLGLVIHADLPHDAEALQHRSGRTGRAGRKGVSVLLVPFSRKRKAERLLIEAGVTATWSGPPSIEAIQKLDNARLLADPILTEEASEDEIATARELMAQRPAEELVAALVRVYRSKLPAPEELRDPGPDVRPRESLQGVPRRERGERNAMMGEFVQFRLDVGRSKNADPKWLLPMICRRGKITKQEIGAIRIFEHETHVEIAANVAEQVAASAKRTSGGDNPVFVPLEAGRTAPEAAGPRRTPKFEKRPRPGRAERNGAKAARFRDNDRTPALEGADRAPAGYVADAARPNRKKRRDATRQAG